ncbi:MAG: hypothetical protein A3E21_01045 [Sulfurimonas sp. RIFCSPHIGHO2_12_FULL_36_9]|jgi:predicted RNA-binding protein YlxR (DUF448 family)|uniref:hypothetical protein n=1 Tax=Sulfurimonas sp. TaxID=2022749 RepID=UPI0008D63C64|nr:hypothetical protein [Sulfurimonas sp.]OHD99824.1 MAG: hypothetical protein A3E21_01045 [Sulfurimonas sp. RIFCSPHIGHO2_12_FULL_36_9]OHE00080.1 MAG: hypothetical protein A2W82_05680 [Sulfurimonas sp. RIFCSPLOWO2_12_36_12]OHE08415.1 MAG: hypothetical protein A3K14_09790 [Sulfurimonas sp. RIFCSPLOWO2_12_FULL_36_74]
MAKKFNQPLRMCISCRQRDAQNNLIRLQCLDSQFSLFRGTGRSFYICKICLEDSKKVLKALMRQCKSGDRDKFSNILKEIITDDRKS